MRTFGIDERSKALTPTVRVLATAYPKGHLIQPHHHEWAQLIYARAGVMTVLTAAGAWVVPPQRAV
jgi:quercetin dioxygenase-like cupin family protein